MTCSTLYLEQPESVEIIFVTKNVSRYEMGWHVYIVLQKGCTLGQIRCLDR